MRVQIKNKYGNAVPFLDVKDVQIDFDGYVLSVEHFKNPTPRDSVVISLKYPDGEELTLEDISFNRA